MAVPAVVAVTRLLTSWPAVVNLVSWLWVCGGVALLVVEGGAVIKGGWCL